jgi:hypothetical protein
MRGNRFNCSTPYKNSICQHALHNGRGPALIKIKEKQERLLQPGYLSNNGAIARRFRTPPRPWSNVRLRPLRCGDLHGCE